MRHLELFAGIGGFRRAIDLFCKDNNEKAYCVGFSEIDKHAVLSYKAMYETDGEIELGDIQKFVADKRLNELPSFDLLTGGFPCQSFSMMGKKRGFKDERGEVFYRIIDILNQSNPKYILLENVRNLKNHDKGKTYNEVIRSLTEDANYEVDSIILNTKDFGLPQTRRRLFIFGIHRKYLKKDQTIKLNHDDVLSVSSMLNRETSLNYYQNVLDGVLNRKANQIYYLSEQVKPTILANGSKSFNSKSEINQMIARPLTASMAKMHRACQDNYYSDEFLSAPNPEEYLKQTFTKKDLENHRIRRITPEEAFKLQGLNNEDIERAKKAGVSNHQLYKQAGNAVSVNTVYAFLNYLNLKFKILGEKK